VAFTLFVRSKTVPPKTSLACIALVVAAYSVACAQDTRHVTEPHSPKVCTVLRAHLSAPHGTLSDEEERMPDTTRLQQAIDSCQEGKAIELRADGNRNIFLSGPIQLRKGITLIVREHTAIFASRNPRDYDMTPGSCGVLSDDGHGCKPLIAAEDAPDSGIMGQGSIDGRGGAEMLGQKMTWWDLAHRAKVLDKHQNCFRILSVARSNNFTLYQITLRNSPQTHVSISHTDGFTAWGVKIITPKTARNTDGIDPDAGTKNATIAWSTIHSGDDNVAIKSDTTGGASNISILHNRFYTGHGMSIGSQTSGGVDHVLVSDLTIDGADNGIRIKSDRSRGGLVRDVHFENVCIRNSRNPLVFTPMYTTFQGDKPPLFRGIALKDVHILTPGAFTFFGLDADHKLDVSLDNVTGDDLQHSEIIAKNAEISISGKRGNLIPSGPEVKVTGTDAPEGSPLACANRFVTLPEIETAPQAAVKVLPEDKTLYVAADGTGDFYSIQRALDVAPSSGGALILVAPGTYREVLTIDKPQIQLRSASPDASKTVVVFNRYASANGGTSHTATVNVSGDDFLAENITFQNDYQPVGDPYPEGSQAVALRVNGDRAVFHNLRLLGHQDTLYAGSKGCMGSTDRSTCRPARQYFSNCYIEGNFDFIFGDGKTVFDHCEIRSLPLVEGFITAQSNIYPQQDSGYVIYKSRLTANAEVSHVWLGRPWRPYSTVTYIDTEMGSHIVGAGWREWLPGKTNSIETSTYSEFGSVGPGSQPSMRDPHTHFLKPEQAKEYEPSTFLRGDDNWNPVTQEIPPLP
jgi:polygalacturonase